ncbi:hypothetical protein J8J14_22965 [Roseomonas sp. SSH11]|uniref:Secreted protein n=1 Tax=Pararoseomonas baculiformis TaxID=2820812 RepID=A0ABS4AN10_9PROT|nr:hypothetical protein [Pararoseomonas baculiformis]MBP0447624.1 hypothetical protein [Pararoseomonas baculiformis]
MLHRLSRIRPGFLAGLALGVALSAGMAAAQTAGPKTRVEGEGRGGPGTGTGTGSGGTGAVTLPGFVPAPAGIQGFLIRPGQAIAFACQAPDGSYRQLRPFAPGQGTVPVLGLACAP